MVLYPYQQEIFTHEWEERTQAASLQGANPPSQIDVWRDVVGVNKGMMYGYGLHSTVVLRPYYYGSGSSSSEWVQRQELNELRNQLEEVRAERDELRVEMENTRVEMANTKNTCEQNNKLMKKLMKMMKYEQTPINEELYDEDDEDGDDEESDSEGQSDEES